MLFQVLGGSRAPHTLLFLRRQMLSFSAVGGCCGYSRVLKSRGLLILLKLTLVSDEGVYCSVNGRVSIQSADHSDLFLPSRDANRESRCYTTVQDGRLTRRGCSKTGDSQDVAAPRLDSSDVSLTQNCQCCEMRQIVHSTPLCKRMHKGLYNWELVRTQFKTLKLNCRGKYSF